MWHFQGQWRTMLRVIEACGCKIHGGGAASHAPEINWSHSVGELSCDPSPLQWVLAVGHLHESLLTSHCRQSAPDNQSRGRLLTDTLLYLRPRPLAKWRYHGYLSSAAAVENQQWVELCEWELEESHKRLSSSDDSKRKQYWNKVQK